jgi:hypothetical protein
MINSSTDIYYLVNMVFASKVLYGAMNTTWKFYDACTSAYISKLHFKSLKTLSDVMHSSIANAHV